MPRIRPPFLISLGLAAVLGVIAAVIAIARHNSSAAQNARDARVQAAYNRASAAFAAQTRPSGISWEQDCPPGLCGTSRLTPEQLKARLERFVGRTGTPLGAPRCAPATPPCGFAYLGDYRGYRVLVTALWQIVPPHTHPPQGAVSRSFHGHRIYFHGSQVTLSLIPPG